MSDLDNNINGLNEQGNAGDSSYNGGYSGVHGMDYKQVSPVYQASGYSYNSPYTHSEKSDSPGKDVRQKVDNKPKKTETKSTGFGVKVARTAVIAAVFGLVVGGVFQGIDIGTDKLREYASKDSASETVSTGDSDTSSGVKTQPVVNSAGGKTLSYDVAEIVKSAQPSIVSITTAATESVQYFFQSYDRAVTGAGSGIIIGQDDNTLFIATNCHVIAGAEEINVGFNDGEMVTASVKGYDEDADIAVVAVNKSDMKDSTKDAISVATVGDSDSLQVGEPAIAIGNALGYGQSVTVGYISALDRSIEDSDGTFIQTDAAINPGNSGGALINSSGQLIGINSVKYVDSTVEGMGFSIPINSAMIIINDIIAGTQKGNAYIGISGEGISKEYSQIYGFPEGIYIKEVEPGSPADKSGLHYGDIIVEFNGDEVYTVEDIQKKLRKCEAGDKVELVVYRADTMGNYDKATVEVTLAQEQ
ncbi:MAG: trypsin-like peptidase domain-containing protein [Eubacterium sp.]|nr:trypsin-like peptidase domain-containing protein [Eubacterium sp.]